MFSLLLLAAAATASPLPLRRLPRDLPHGGVLFGHGSYSHGAGSGRVIVRSDGGSGVEHGSVGSVASVSYTAEECGSGEVRNSDGRCAAQEVSRKIYVFAGEQSAPEPPAPQPDPEVNIDVILVKAPSAVVNDVPLVAPAPEQKTVVYVLSKRPSQEQQVIEVPSVPDEPEVYFVNYAEGENPTLPGGVDLQTALSQSGGFPEQGGHSDLLDNFISDSYSNRG